MVVVFARARESLHHSIAPIINCLRNLPFRHKSTMSEVTVEFKHTTIFEVKQRIQKLFLFCRAISLCLGGAIILAD
jgi:hypothetical protein